MNEQNPTEKQPSPAYVAFLEVVKSHGAKATILVGKEGEDKKLEYWNLKKGATEVEPVTEDNLVDFRALSRKERRGVFHTPYKHGRRNAVNPNYRTRV